MIEINNLTTDLINREFVEKVADAVLREEHLLKKGEDLSFAFVSWNRIRELNKRYRKKNYSTDVLSFPLQSKLSAVDKLEAPLGEIVICSDEVKKNARRFKSSFEKELARVIIHGVLHILGYEHEGSKKDREKMERKEKYYLSKVRSLL